MGFANDICTELGGAGPRERTAMTTIELDDTIAQTLRETAKSHGMTVEEYVRLRVLGDHQGTHSADASSYVDFDEELDNLVFSGPTLPDGFSRADIYSDHA